MFVREKRIGSYSYLYLVETVRENGKTKRKRHQRPTSRAPVFRAILAAIR